VSTHPAQHASSPVASGRIRAQLTLFEAGDGWRYSLWVTNLSDRLRGWR